MKISVIGAAGTIGSAITFCLGQRALAHEIAMIDLAGDLLEQQYTDMREACSTCGVTVSYGDMSALQNSQIVIIAAAVQPAKATVNRDERLRPNIRLFHGFAQSIKRYCPNAKIIQVSNPIEPLCYILHAKAQLQPGQVLGYSYNDSVRFELMLKQALKLATADKVSALVLGEHGSSKVLLFDHIYINGKHVTLDENAVSAVSEANRNLFPRLEYLREKTGRTAAWITASGVGDMVAALLSPAPKPFVCSMYMQGEYGYKDIFCGVPVLLGQNKVISVNVLNLSPQSRLELDKSAAAIKEITAEALKELANIPIN